MTTTVATSPSPTRTEATTAAVGAFLRLFARSVRDQSRDLYFSLRMQRDVVVDRWLDHIDNMRDEYEEDQRQVRAHTSRALRGVGERISSIRAASAATTTPAGPAAASRSRRHRRKNRRGGGGGTKQGVLHHPAEGLEEEEYDDYEAEPGTFPLFCLLPAEIRLQIWEEAVALPGPRAVMLRSPYGHSQNIRESLGLSPFSSRKRRVLLSRGYDPHSWTSPTPAPALLHVCSESRAVALRRYSLVLATSFPPSSSSSSLSSSSSSSSSSTVSTSHREDRLYRPLSKIANKKKSQIPQVQEPLTQPPIYADLTRDYICLSSREVSPACNALWRATPDASRIRHLAVAAGWGTWAGGGSVGVGAGVGVVGGGGGGATTLYDDDDDDGARLSRRHHLPPPSLLLLGKPGFESLEDVLMVRSLRWQMGRLPRGAARDFAGWVDAEKGAEGVSHWRTRWREDGVMVIREAGRGSIDVQ